MGWVMMSERELGARQHGTATHEAGKTRYIRKGVLVLYDLDILLTLYHPEIVFV